MLNGLQSIQGFGGPVQSLGHSAQFQRFLLDRFCVAALQPNPSPDPSDGIND
jgi:hypothetical protein